MLRRLFPSLSRLEPIELASLPIAIIWVLLEFGGMFSRSY